MSDLIKVKCFEYKFVSYSNCGNPFVCSILRPIESRCNNGIIEVDWITYLRYNNIFISEVEK